MRDDQGLDNASPEYDHHDMANTDPVTRYDPFDGALSMSLATRVGNLVYTSGIIGMGSDMKIPGNPKDEFRQVFSSIGEALANLGTSLEHAVDMTNFFAGDFEAVYPLFNEVRADVFGTRFPTSTSVRVAQLLHPDAHVEVRLTAVVP